MLISPAMTIRPPNPSRHSSGRKDSRPERDMSLAAIRSFLTLARPHSDSLSSTSPITSHCASYT